MTYDVEEETGDVVVVVEVELVVVEDEALLPVNFSTAATNSGAS